MIHATFRRSLLHRGAPALGAGRADSRVGSRVGSHIGSRAGRTRLPGWLGRGGVAVLTLLTVLTLSWALPGAAQAAPPSGDGHAADPSAHFNWFDIGYKNKDVYGGELEAGEEAMSAPFALMLVNVAVVIFILGWKVRPMIRKFLAKRHLDIKEALEEAGKLRDEARAKLDEYNVRLDKAEREIDELIANMRKDAEAEKERILAEAQAQAQAMKREAESRIAAEIERARLDLEREVVVAAVAAAEKLIGDKATKKDQTKLVDTFIKDVQTSAAAEERA